MDIFHGSTVDFKRASAKAEGTGSFQMIGVFEIAANYARDDGYLYVCDMDNVDLTGWAIGGKIIGEKKHGEIQKLLKNNDLRPDHYNLLKSATPQTDVADLIFLMQDNESIKFLKTLGYRGFYNEKAPLNDETMAYCVFFYDEDIPQLEQHTIRDYIAPRPID